MLTFLMTYAKCWYVVLDATIELQSHRIYNNLDYCFCHKVTEFTDKVNFYVMSAVSFFKSMWPDVKSSAALFVGERIYADGCYNIVSLLQVT